MQTKLRTLFFLSSIFLATDLFALHITQEDIDGTGPHFIIEDIWALIVLGVIALFIIGIILLIIFSYIWQLCEKAVGINRGKMYANGDIIVGHQQKKYRRYLRLKKIEQRNQLSSHEESELEQLVSRNEVFRVKDGSEIEVLFTNIYGISKIHLGNWAATLYVKYSNLKQDKEIYPFD